MAKRKTERVLVLAVLIAFSGLLAYEIFSSFSLTAFLPQATTAQVLSKDLDVMVPNGQLRPGASVDIGKLRKNDGGTLLITLAEVTFTDTTIEPQGAWEQLLRRPALIVSSGDEHLLNDGGISQYIGSGCGIDQVRMLIPTGTTYVVPCVGDYKKHLPNVRYVGNAIIVASKGVDETPNCKFAANVSVSARETGVYDKCIHDAIVGSLLDLFGKSEIMEIDTLVLPALGTGAGDVQMGIFYQAAATAIQGCLASIHGCYLPRRIIFTVWSGSPKGAWPGIRDAFARNIAGLSDRWNRDYSPDGIILKQARYLGVIIVIAISIGCLNFTGRVANTPLLRSNGLSLVVLGWAIAATGAFSIMSDLVDVVLVRADPRSISSIVFNIVFGGAAALICGVIQTAARVFNKQ